MPNKGSKRKDTLTAREVKFVGAWAGNDTEAARKIGLKSPNKAGPRMAAIPRVAAAIRLKQDAFAIRSGRKLANRISITRNDIINRLDKLSQEADSDSAKISALGHLINIFGLSAKDAKTDLFAGWTDEELEWYRTTGELPARFGPEGGAGAGDRGAAQAAPQSGSQPAK